MIVVSDTTPLHYLILIDEVDLLPKLLGRVVIPTIVFRELQADGTPDKVRTYFQRTPNWLSIKDSPEVIDRELDGLDPGERAAILLSEELSADGIMVDELAGRRIAAERGLRVIGTQGLLEAAGRIGLINFLDGLDRIKAAGFFISRTLEDELRAKNS